MRSRTFRQRVQVAVAGTASLVLALVAVVGLASAHTGKPASITASVSGNSVTVQGTWTWNSQATATAKYKIGYAIDWGDVTSGNAVSTFHIGDGTAATNVVLSNVSPSSGASGSWGPTGHTYTAPGTYTICVIMYDIGPVLATSQPTSGQFSSVAGGTGHNPDNSVEENMTPATQCTQVQVAAATATPTAVPTSTVAGATGTPVVTPIPTPTPFQSFLGATAVPSLAPTLPPTSTDSGSGSSGGSNSMSLILLALSMILGVYAIRPLARSRR